MKKTWIFCLVAGSLAPPCFAQSLSPSILNSAGGTAVVGTRTHEWSVGEMVLVETAASGPVTVTQGLLQPGYSDHLAIEESASGLQEHLLLYPNPTTGSIYLQPDLAESSRLQYRVLDLSGKVFALREAWLYTGKETQTVDLGGYASGMYLLQVEWQQNGKSRRAVYKIEKH